MHGSTTINCHVIMDMFSCSLHKMSTSLQSIISVLPNSKLAVAEYRHLSLAMRAAQMVLPSTKETLMDLVGL